MSPVGERVPVEVGGRRLTLSNLGKVLYPEAAFTKGEVVDYYSRIAPVLLAHVAGRPMTFKRFPDGVEGAFFFEKNAPRHRPEWLRTVRLPAPGSTKNRDTIDYAVIEDLPGVVWAANQAALELHVPMWRVGPRGAVRDADTLVFDLDPGPPATIVECTRVAELVRDALAVDGLTAYPKTSGSKGLQLYVPLRPTSSARTWAYARELATHLEQAHPDLVVFRMEKALRPGKVLVDWSQNSAAKTTVAPYSLRARPRPTVSTPVTWDEVAACRRPEDLVFLAPDVLDRVADLGDLFAPVLAGTADLPDRPAAATAR